MSKVHKEPFAQVPEWIVYSSASDKAVRVYAALDRHENDGTGRAFPGRAALAGKLGCSVRTIDRAVEELVDIGAVVVENHYRKDGSQSSNSYWLWPRHPDENGTGGRPNGEAPPRQKCTPPSPEVAPLIGNETQRDDSQGNESQLEGISPATVDVAKSVTDDFWQASDPKPMTPWVGIRAVVRKALAAGWSESDIRAALPRCRTISLGWLEAEMRKGRNGSGKPDAMDGAREYARREGLL